MGNVKLKKEQEEEILKMPKVVLHLHLDGSLRPKTVLEELNKMEELNPKTNKPYTLQEVENELMVSPDCRDLNEYLTKFDMPGKVLQTGEQIERATFELYEDLAKQGVVYAEVRFAPSKHLEKGMSYDQVVESAIKGMERAKSQYGIDGNLILCCMRGKGNINENIKTVKVAKRFFTKGVFGVDLAGAEALFPTKDFKYVFDMARKARIPFTIHAGEADGPESIRQALDFGAKRIGHGIRCIEDEELMRYLREKKIVLEICPISNLQTQAIQSEAQYPLEKIYRRGINTTINTDNNTVSSTDILNEYRWVLENTNLTIVDLLRMNLSAAERIFGVTDQKVSLLGKIKEYVNTFVEKYKGDSNEER